MTTLTSRVLPGPYRAGPRCGRTPLTGADSRRAPHRRPGEEMAGDGSLHPRGDRGSSPTSPHGGTPCGARRDDRGRRTGRAGSACPSAPGEDRAGRTRHPLVGAARERAPATLGGGPRVPRRGGTGLSSADTPVPGCSRPWADAEVASAAACSSAGDTGSGLNPVRRSPAGAGRRSLRGVGARSSSVSVAAGETKLTVMPWAPSSRAATAVGCPIAPLPTAYGAMPGPAAGVRDPRCRQRIRRQLPTRNCPGDQDADSRRLRAGPARSYPVLVRP